MLYGHVTSNVVGTVCRFQLLFRSFVASHTYCPDVELYNVQQYNGVLNLFKFARIDFYNLNDAYL